MHLFPLVSIILLRTSDYNSAASRETELTETYMKCCYETWAPAYEDLTGE
jgi:hypothetical protein